MNTLIRANRLILIVLTRNFILNTIMENESWWWHKMIPFFFQTLVELVYLTLYKKWKLSIKDFFSKCGQIRSSPRIQTYLLKKFLMENLIFCALLFWSSSRIWTHLVHFPLFLTEWGIISANAISRKGRYTDLYQYSLTVSERKLFQFICCVHICDQFSSYQILYP